MKKIAAIFALITGVVFSPVYAINYYWDTSAGLGNNVGGSGNLATTNATWSTDPNGSATLTAGTFTSTGAMASTGDMFFQGTAGTVTVTNSLYMPSINVITTGYTFTTGANVNRYLYSTNGIILADGITLNLSSFTAAYNAGSLGIVGNITNASGASGFSTVAITGNSGTTAGSGIRILSRFGTGSAGTNHWYVNLSVKTTGTGGAIIGTADSGSWLVLRNPVTVDSGSRLVLSPGGGTTRTILVSNSITTSAADALAIGDANNTGLVILRHSNNVITGNLNVIGQLGYQGSLNALGTARVVLTQGSTFGQSGTISGGNETITNPITIQGDTTFGGLGAGFSCYFGGDVDLAAGTRTVSIANSSTLNGAVTNGNLTFTNSSSTRSITFNGPLALTNLTVVGRGTINLNGANVISNLIVSNTVYNSVMLGSGPNTINSYIVNAGGLSAAELGNGTKSLTLTGVGATATLSNTATSGSLGVGPLTLGGSNNIVMATSGSTSIASSGGITLSGSSNVITLNGSVLASGLTYPLITGTSVNTNGLTGPVTLTGTGVNNAVNLVLNGGPVTSGANIYTFRSTATSLELQVDANATQDYSWSGGTTGTWDTDSANTVWTLGGSPSAFSSGGNAAIDTTSGSVGLTLAAGGIQAGYVNVSGGNSAALDGGSLATLGLATTGTALTVNNAVTATNFSVTNSSVSGSGSISTAGGTTVQCDTDQSLSLAITGTGGVTKSGAGTLTVSGGSSYTGNLVVSSGGLATSGSTAIPDNATLVLSNLATLNLGGNETVGALFAAFGSTNNLGAYTLTAGGNNQSYTNGALTYGSGGIVKNGKGIMYLNQSASTYSGGFTLNDGEIAYTSSGNAGADGVVTNSVFGTGTLTLNGGTVRSSSDTSGRNIFNPVVLNGDVTFGSNSAAATITFNSTAGKTTTLTKDVTVTNIGSVTWEQPIVGSAFRLTKAGVTSLNSAGSTNLITFRASNDIAGMTLAGGTVGYKNRNAFGSGTLILKEGVTVGQDSAINNTPLTGNDQVDRAIPNGIRLDGNVTFGLGNTANHLGGDIDVNGADRVVTLGNTTYAYGKITNGAKLTIDNGTGTGTRTFAMFGSNNYTGGTVVLTNAALAIGHDNALSTGNLIFSNSGLVASIGILRSSTLSGVASQTRTITNNIQISTGMTMVLDSVNSVVDSVGATNSVVLDTILSGILSGPGGLTKSNNHTVTLLGNNSYSGATAVVNGSLVVVTNNFSATITSNTVAITFSNTPANGTYVILPGALTGTYTITNTVLSSSQKATLSTASPASVTVADKSSQSITGFASSDTKAFGDSAYALTVTPGASTSPLTFSSDNTSVATVSSAGVVTIVGAGSTTLRVNQAADANYLAAAEVTQALTVAKATPSITASPTAGAITYGQTLADSSLTGGTGSVAGTFAFTSPSTAPNAGTANQDVTFTPTGTANYNTVTTTVSVTVNKATPSITGAPTASAITAGQALSASTLSGGSGSVAGSFAWTTPSTVPGSTGPHEVTFTPTDTANYNTATTNVSVTVNAAGGISNWLGGAATNAANVGKYLIGGGTNVDAASERPVIINTNSTNLILSAIVRTNDTNGSVVGQWVTNVSGFSSLASGSNEVTGTRSANQSGVDATHFERREFSVPRTNGTNRLFLRLKATLAP